MAAALEQVVDRRKQSSRDSKSTSIISGQGLEGGAVRTWWEISDALAERGEPRLSAQCVKDTHDRAIKKLRAALAAEFGLRADE